jgi:hypothetical protein
VKQRNGVRIENIIDASNDFQKKMFLSLRFQTAPDVYS